MKIPTIAGFIPLLLLEKIRPCSPCLPPRLDGSHNIPKILPQFSPVHICPISTNSIPILGLLSFIWFYRFMVRKCCTSRITTG